MSISRWLGLKGSLLGLALGLVFASNAVCAAEKDLRTPAPAAVASHPLDPLLKMAEEGLARVKKEVVDYSAILVIRERLKGELGDYTFQEVNIRNRKVEGEKVITPFAVYLRFLKPADKKDRQCVWVEGANNDKMWVQESPLFGIRVPPVWILPEGSLAMAENRYPITHIGIENLLEKLIAKGQADRARNFPEECEVTSTKGAKIDGRLCTMYSIKHLKQRPEYEFYRAEIFIDDELQVPVRYAAYSFPAEEGAAAPVEEEYTYTKLKLNIGLAADFFDR